MAEVCFSFQSNSLKCLKEIKKDEADLKEFVIFLIQKNDPMHYKRKNKTCYDTASTKKSGMEENDG